MLLLISALLAGLALIWFFVTQPFTGSRGPRAVLEISSENLRAHVHALSAELPPRAHDPAALDVTAAYIRRHLEKYSDTVLEQEYEVQGDIYRNVIARFGPTGGKRMVVGAHYDTAGGLPGADDNASGVAGLMEIARRLQQKPPAGAVELVAFTLEEPPYFTTGQMGSAVHAQSLRRENVDVRLMISLEMIGYFSDEPDSQSYPTPLLAPFYPDAGNFIAVVGNLSQWRGVRRSKRIMTGATTLPVYSVNAPAIIPGVDFSDHRNYWDAGFPALMVTDTAFYRNAAYHTEGDTADRLDYTRMAQVIEGIMAVIYEF